MSNQDFKKSKVFMAIYGISGAVSVVLYLMFNFGVLYGGWITRVLFVCPLIFVTTSFVMVMKAKMNIGLRILLVPVFLVVILLTFFISITALLGIEEL